LLTENGAERLELAGAQRALRARLQHGTDALTSMLTGKSSDGFMFSALLTYSGTEVFETARA